jgi:hypothetical protein
MVDSPLESFLAATGRTTRCFFARLTVLIYQDALDGVPFASAVVHYSNLAHATSAVGQNENPPVWGLCQLPPNSDIAVVLCPNQSAQCCLLFRVYGGAVICIEGRSEMERIQLASRRRPVVRSPSLRLRAISTATARIRCAMQGDPCISGSVTRSSKKSAMR